MSSPSSPQPPHPPPPPSSTVSPKKPQPIPWSQQETLHLILTYQDKWHSANRRHLRAPQWEEVSSIVASRCGHDLSSPEAKSATQCRHKMEKLRRRYRSELHRASSSWPFFSLMDSMERGPPPAHTPLPISARPLSEYYGEQEEEEEEDEEEEDEEEGGDYESYNNNNKLRSINHILRKPSVVNRFPGSNLGFLPPPQPAAEGGGKRKRVEVEEDGSFGLIDEVKKLIEKMKVVERKKMEMVKETERWRMEMERKRMEMMIASQRKILDMIASASSDD